MRNSWIIILAFFFLIGCKESTTKSDIPKVDKVVFNAFGETISDENTISKEEMHSKFKNLKEGDTLSVKFASNINEVCKAKGCWMKLDLGGDAESMVRFKDYGFFVPLNSDNKDIIVNGKAYVTKIPVKELQHYAKDAGKSDEEIALITEPEFTYAFEADGVLIKK